MTDPSATTSTTTPTPAGPDTPGESGTPRRIPADPLRGSRTSGLWTSIAVGAVALLLLMVFVAQNTDPVAVRFLGWDGQFPLAVTVLVAAALGMLLTVVAGSLRILQLRRRVRRERRGVRS